MSQQLVIKITKRKMINNIIKQEQELENQGKRKVSSCCATKVGTESSQNSEQPCMMIDGVLFFIKLKFLKIFLFNVFLLEKLPNKTKKSCQTNAGNLLLNHTKIIIINSFFIVDKIYYY